MQKYDNRAARYSMKASPPRGVLAPEYSVQGLRHRRWHPTPALAPYIEHYWLVEWKLPPGRIHVAQTMPHPCVHLTVEADRARVGGIGTRRFRRVLQDRGWVFGVKFRPGGFYPLFRKPLSLLTDRTVGIRSIFGAEGSALTAQIRAVHLPPTRIAAFERFLGPKLQRDPELFATRDLVERIASDHSLLTLGQLTSLGPWSLRTLQRRFDTYIGVHPKWIIRRYRLHEAMSALELGTMDAAALARALGYFDQAHFIRDFKAATGRTPRAYASKRLS